MDGITYLYKGKGFMITKQRLMEIFTEVVYSPGAFDKANLEKAVDQILSESGWQPMETAPKDRPILLWGKSSGYWWRLSGGEMMCLPAKWDIGEWEVVGDAMDGNDGTLCVLNPVAWMELPDGPE